MKKKTEKEKEKEKEKKKKKKKETKETKKNQKKKTQQEEDEEENEEEEEEEDKTNDSITIIFMTPVIFDNTGNNDGAKKPVRLNMSPGLLFAELFVVDFLGGQHFGACRGMDFELHAAAYIRDGLLG